MWFGTGTTVKVLTEMYVYNMSHVILLAGENLLTMRKFACILAFIETFQSTIIFAYVRGGRIDCVNAKTYF